MTTIGINVNDGLISVLTPYEIEPRDKVKIQFIFNDNKIWTGRRVACFETKYDSSFIEVLKEDDDTVTVPMEISKSQTFSVTLYSVYDGNLYTTNSVVLKKGVVNG